MEKIQNNLFKYFARLKKSSFFIFLFFKYKNRNKFDLKKNYLYYYNMNNNKNYQEIIEKRKATIQKKRDAKIAKKQVILDKINNNIEYLNKVKSAVEKRKDTISKKEFIKDLFNAGAAFGEEMKKGHNFNTSQTERETRKGERDALNGKFKLNKYYDNMDMWAEVVIDNQSYRLIVPNESVIKNYIDINLRKQISDNNSKEKLKCYITIKYTVVKDTEQNLYLISSGSKELIEETYNHFTNGQIFTINTSSMIFEVQNQIIQQLNKDLEESKGGSGYILYSIDELQIKTARSKPAVGGSYIELPDFIKNKKACVNIKNDDNKCFIWCLLAFYHYNTDVKGGCKNNASSYKKYIEDIKEPENISYPVDIEAIPEFEKLNSLKINVFELNKDNSIKILHNSYDKYNKVVNLLLINDGFENYHYVWIKDINKLDKSNVASHCSMYRCEYCLSERFLTKEKLFNHIQKCKNNLSSLEEVLPEEGKNNILQFKNHNNKFMHPFYISADFESTLTPVNEINSNTTKYQRHDPNSYGLKFNCIHDEYSKPVKIFNSSNPDLVRENFIKDIEEYALYSYRLTQQNKKNIIMSEEQKMNHKKATICFECKKSFSQYEKVEKGQKMNPLTKVKHHDHITGEFISSLCYECNINLQYKKFIPVYIHNLKGYDSHLFVSSLFKYGYQHNKSDNISCIPNNEEKYISFSKNIKVDEYEDKAGKMKNVMYEIRFLDTFAFMASSIENLSNNLRSSSDDVNELRKIFKNTSDEFKNDEQFKLMIQKGVYPYDYIDNFNRLFENYLPDINSFYSKLNKSKCDINDYKHAQNVFNKFQCKNILDYHNIYLKSDVLLLSDIWDNFRNVCFKNYGLDTCYYYTAPGLSFDSMLKITKINLELLTDIEMFKMVESGIRGGISQISHRHAIANNKYMSNYDPSKNKIYKDKKTGAVICKDKLDESKINEDILNGLIEIEYSEDSYIIYLDANNLYGYAMCQYLPTDNFKWNNEEWTLEQILELKDDADIGYLFDVNVSYSEELHDYFNQYPPLPSNMNVKKEYLNKWQQENYNESKINKLCCSLLPKNNYVVNYRYLKIALSLGVKLERVNRVLQFNQKPFLKEYIMLNTNLRTKAKNDFEKDFYKLMNNSVYGKTMENVRNRINFRLISTEEEALRVKNLKRFTIFDNNLVGLHIQKTQVVLNKPIYLGQCILDDSKVLMSNFHYNTVIKNAGRQNVNLCFTDTDSFCYEFKRFDIFDFMKNNKEHFDLSDYPKDHPLYCPDNKKVIGKFKNETSEKIITEFVGLRPKLYSFKTDDGKEKKTCKGVKRSVVKNEINVNDYKHTLYTHENKEVIQNGIRSYTHEIYTETQKKIALSCFDDKIFINDDNISCISFGHKLISKLS